MPFNDYSTVTPSSPLRTHPDSVAPTASDTVDEPSGPFRAIRATGAGNVSIMTLSGTTRVCAFAAGETRQIGGTRINVTGTTATGLEVMR